MHDGAQAMVFSKDPDADRAFARDLLGLSCSEAGGGWLLFSLPPGQSGMDEFGGDDCHQLYLRCRDLDQAIAALLARGIDPGPVREAGGCRYVSIGLPGGGRVQLYEDNGEL